MARNDVNSICNCCDAGREGELIFRLVYNKCGCRKPVERLWISSMEDSAIKEGFEKRQNPRMTVMTLMTTQEPAETAAL